MAGRQGNPIAAAALSAVRTGAAPMTRRARPHFRVDHGPGGQPFIVMEQRDGAPLDLFRKRITFDLPKSATVEDATEVVNFLSNHLVDMSES
jgi:hypothetical protein